MRISGTIMKITIILAVVFSSNSCEKEMLADDELTLRKAPFTGNQLRIDGYYSSKFGNIYRIYFLYNDGTVLSGGDVFEDKIQGQEQRYADGSFLTRRRIINLFKWHAKEKSLCNCISHNHIFGRLNSNYSRLKKKK